MKSMRKKSTRFHVGDHVRYHVGDQTYKGTIVEDQGPIGVNGRHLFRVSVPADPYEPQIRFFPEDELEPAPETDDRAALTKERILEYLVKYAGLRSMLRVESPGRQFQPRAWICLNQLGDLTHTYYPERGLVGGGTVPYGALCFDRIRKEKVGEVLEFLEHFGLTKKEAEQVIRQVGVTKK